MTEKDTPVTRLTVTDEIAAAVLKHLRMNGPGRTAYIMPEHMRAALEAAFVSSADEPPLIGLGDPENRETRKHQHVMSRAELAREAATIAASRYRDSGCSMRNLADEIIDAYLAALGGDALPEAGNDLLLSDAIYLEGLALVRTGAEASRLTAIAYRIRSALVASPKNLKEPRRD